MGDETRRSVRILLASAVIAFCYLIPARATTPLVKVTIDCARRDDMVLLLKVDSEYKSVNLNSVPPPNSAAKAAPMTLWGMVVGSWIDPNGTLGSGLLHGHRADWQPSHRDEETGAASFNFVCGRSDFIRDVVVETDGEIEGWYERRLPKGLSPAGEFRDRFPGYVKLADVRFAPYLFDSTRQEAKPDDPYESVRLQFFPHEPVEHGLLLNDPDVFRAAGKNWLEREWAIQCRIKQIAKRRKAQPPGLSENATEKDWKLLPKEFRRIRLDILEAGK